jgi:hypothetical protein
VEESGRGLDHESLRQDQVELFGQQGIIRKSQNIPVELESFVQMNRE